MTASDPTATRPQSPLTDDDKRSLLILLMEDLRGAFFPVSPRTDRVIELATDLCYKQVAEHAQYHLDDDGYQDGRHFRVSFAHGGYEGPPFPVTRKRADASPALIAEVENYCEYPEYRLDDDGAAS